MSLSSWCGWLFGRGDTLPGLTVAGYPEGCPARTSLGMWAGVPGLHCAHEKATVVVVVNVVVVPVVVVAVVVVAVVVVAVVVVAVAVVVVLVVAVVEVAVPTTAVAVVEVAVLAVAVDGAVLAVISVALAWAVEFGAAAFGAAAFGAAASVVRGPASGVENRGTPGSAPAPSLPAPPPALAAVLPFPAPVPGTTGSPPPPPPPPSPTPSPTLSSRTPMRAPTARTPGVWRRWTRAASVGTRGKWGCGRGAARQCVGTLVWCDEDGVRERAGRCVHRDEQSVRSGSAAPCRPALAPHHGDEAVLHVAAAQGQSKSPTRPHTRCEVTARRGLGSTQHWAGGGREGDAPYEVRAFAPPVPGLPSGAARGALLPASLGAVPSGANVWSSPRSNAPAPTPANPATASPPPGAPPSYKGFTNSPVGAATPKGPSSVEPNHRMAPGNGRPLSAGCVNGNTPLQLR